MNDFTITQLKQLAMPHTLNRYGLNSGDSRPFVESDLMLIDLVAKFLEKITEPSIRWETKDGSYRWKHYAEDYLNVYVPNGVLIAAALRIGYQGRRDYQGVTSPNMEFKMRTRKKYLNLFAPHYRQQWRSSQKWRPMPIEVNSISEGTYQECLKVLESDITEGIVYSDNRFNGTKLPRYYGCPKNLQWIKSYLLCQTTA